MKILTDTFPSRPFSLDEEEWKRNIFPDPTLKKLGSIDIILGANEMRKILKDFRNDKN